MKDYNLLSVNTSGQGLLGEGNPSDMETTTNPSGEVRTEGLLTPEQSKELKQLFIETAYDIAPGTGEARAMMYADEAAKKAAQAYRGGKYLKGAGYTAESYAELLGAIPVAGAALGAITDVNRFGKGAYKILNQPPKKGVTADEVFSLSTTNKPKMTFRDWAEQDTSPNLLDLSKSKPTFPDYPEPERFFPTSRADVGRVRDLAENEQVEYLAQKFAKKGAKILPESWYATSPMYKIYVEELGEKAGKEKFIRDYQLFAASSPQQKVPENIKVGSLYQYMAQQGEKLPDAIRKKSQGFGPDEIFPPPGYGHLVQGNHLLNSRRIISGEGMSDMDNPKPVSFAANLLGNENPLTADIHFTRAMGMFSEDPRFLLTKAEVNVLKDGKPVQVKNKKGKLVNKKKEINPQKLVKKGKMSMEEALQNPGFWTDSPKKTEYALLEDYSKKIAKKLGMTTARFQEALWLGAGKITGLQSPPEPFLRTLEKKIKYTAEQLGADPETVLRQYVRGEIPLAQMGADQQSRYGGLLA